MGKIGVFYLIFVILILSLSFVSALSFSDFWNKITGKVVEEGTCSGNVLSCDFYSYEYICGGIDGCSWTGDFCMGSPTQCESFDDDKLACNNQPGCKWYGALRPEETGTTPTLSGGDGTTGTSPTTSQTYPTSGPSTESTNPFVNFFSRIFSQEIESEIQREQPMFKGYIIKFTEDPLVVKKNKLEKEIGSPEEIRQRIESHRNKIIQQRENFKGKALNALNKAPGQLKILGEFENTFNGIALDITREEANSLKSLSEVEEIYLNRKVNITLQDSVPLINADDVWLLDANGNNCATSGQPCLTGQGVTIGIIDTGVDYTHGDLGSCTNSEFLAGTCTKVIGGYDFSDNDNDPMDYMGHGTHVAATAAGNGVLKGVAPDASIVAYKVFPNSYSDVIIAAIERSVDPNQDNDFTDHLDIISLSLGGPGNPDDPMSQSIDNAVDLGVVAVIAAGNEPYCPEGRTASPGTARKAITVGATDKFDNMAFFSCKGFVVWEDNQGNIKAIIKPDIVAPGVDICAAQWNDAWQDRECLDTEHTAISGTSMATPHVSGAVALIKQKHPDWNPREIKTVLRNTAFNLGYDVLTQGYGKIDILNAINSNKPPIAILETGGEFSGVIDIYGTASGENFVNYSLYYGDQSRANTVGDEEGWNEITVLTTPIENGILYSGLDTILLSEGENILRLVVRDINGQESEDRNVIIVDNIEITSPLNNDVYRLGDSVEFIGTVKGSTLQNYLLEYQDPGSGIWSSEGFTLVNNGNSEIINGIIGTFNSGILPKSDFYTMRLTANYGGKQSQEYVRDIYFDSTLKEGWPVRIEWEFSLEQQSLINLASDTEFYTLIPKTNLENLQEESTVVTMTKDEIIQQVNNESSILSSGFYYWAGNLEPVVYDINNDGFEEIIVYKGGNPPKLLVYNQDGSLLWVKPVGASDAAGGNLHIPLVGDLDDDGFGEIIVYNYNGYNPDSELFAFNHNGTLLWSAFVPKDFKPTMLAADLDLDGNKEIVIKGNSGIPEEKMVIIDNNGEIINSWFLEDISWGASIVGSPAVGNFDDDSDFEIVSAGPAKGSGDIWENGNFIGWDSTGVIYVYNLDGSVVEGWPVYTDGIMFSSPVVGDINNDGQDNIVIGMMYASDVWPDERYGGLYVFDRSGNVLPGWPVEKGREFWSTPSLLDLDKDGNLEIGADKLGALTYLFRSDGTVMSGWPQKTSWNSYYSSIVGDINGDNSLDILTTAGGIYSCPYNCGGVYAWNSDGTLIDGFPKITEVDAQAPATVADIDNDGKVELIASSDWDFDKVNGKDKFRGSIYVWELDASYNPDLMPWPMFMHDPQHTGCYNCSFPPPAEIEYEQKTCKVDCGNIGWIGRWRCWLRPDDTFVTECSLNPVCPQYTKEISTDRCEIESGIRPGPIPIFPPTTPLPGPLPPLPPGYNPSPREG